MNRNQHSSESGSSVIEFLLCTTFFLLPLLFGTAVTGLCLITSIEVTEFTRDAAHLFSYGIDFSSTSGQQMLGQIAPGLASGTPPVLTSGGNAVVIFSIVTPISQTDCTGAGFTASNCSNMGSTVITRRIVVGNTSLLTSRYATPSSSIINSSTGVISSGTPSPSYTGGYMNDSSAQVQNFSISSLPDGQYAYIAEVYVATPTLGWWGSVGTNNIRSTFIF